METPGQPQRFGSYLVLERIGDGGMAEIFLAKMTGYSGFEKYVALKKILPRYSSSPAFAKMLIHEAKLAARIQHFNVVQVLDLGEIDGHVFIAMEYVRGRDLAALLSNTYRRRERLPLSVSLCIALEFLTGLDFAHRMVSEEGAPLGLIHRDISPQNVLISYEGEVKLTDFGIARVIESKGDFKLPGNLHGKFGYMSPEQVDGLPLDQRSDIFGAGVVLHEMLTGQRLFRGKTPKATIEMIRSMDIPAPSTINPDVPPEVDQICAKALARDRDTRYQTVGSFLGDLSRVTDKLPQRSSRRDLSVYMRRQFGAGPGERSRVALSNTSSGRVPIGEILVSRLGVKPSHIEIALAEQRARGGRLGEILVDSGVISDDTLARSLAMQANLKMLNAEALGKADAPAKLIARFPRTVALGTSMLPIELSAAGAVLAVADPYDTHAVLEAKIILGVSETTLVVAAKSLIRETVSRWYGPEEVMVEATDIVIEQTEAAVPTTPLVIIADPDKDGSATLAARLREEEYEVLVFHDGKKARAACRERPPTVAILDVALPGIDGYNVLLDLRNRESDAAVFLLSSRADEFGQAKSLELGADDFLTKPLNVEVTTSKVRREVQKRSGSVRRVAAPVSFGGVSGSLEDMTVLDILQSLELGRKSAHVVIQYEDGREGTLGVKLGDLRGASAGERQGAEAFYALAKPGPGAFRIEYRSPDLADSISQPNTFLMLEALRRLDEADKKDEPAAAFTEPESPSFSSRLVPVAQSTLLAPRAPVGVTVPPPPMVNTEALVGDLELSAPPPPPKPRSSSARLAATTPAPPPPTRSPSGAAWTTDLPLGATFPALSPWAQRSPTPTPPNANIPAGLAAPWSVASTPPPSRTPNTNALPPAPPQPAYRGPPTLEAVHAPRTLARVPIQRVASTMVRQPQKAAEPEEPEEGSILNPLE